MFSDRENYEMIPSARKCSSCGQLKDELTLAKLGDKYLCQVCLTQENIKNKVTTYRERKAKTQPFKVKCYCCRKVIPQYLEQIYKDKLYCPICCALIQKLSEQITEVNQHGKDLSNLHTKM